MYLRFGLLIALLAVLVGSTTAASLRVVEQRPPSAPGSQSAPSATASNRASSAAETVVPSAAQTATALRAAAHLNKRGSTSSAPGGTPAVPAANVFVVAGGSAGGDGTAAHPFQSIQQAIDSAKSGDVIGLGAGTFAPFILRNAGVRVVGTSAAATTVSITGTGQSGVDITAANAGVSNLSVSGCRANPNPAGGFETSGTASIRIENAASGALVTGVKVSNGSSTNSFGLPFGCFGIWVGSAPNVSVRGNEITGQGLGVFANRSGAGLVIDANNVHDNNVLIRNTTSPGSDDFGAIGISFFLVTNGVVASNNQISNNEGSSHDWGHDGGAFEIYESSNVTMSANTINGNDDVLETGTGSASSTCSGNKFLNNRATGVKGSTYDLSTSGMFLRCAQQMQISGNTFTNFLKPVFDISTNGGFAGSVSGMSITNNKVVAGLGRVYAMQTDVRSQISAGQNTYNWTGSIATDWNNNWVSNLAAWQSLTGLDLTSTATS
jgi:nitrous oxidase accessory protein NosD